jgi:hypothetical protein
MAKIQVWGWRCERCEHVWVSSKPDDPQEPRVCPKCKSPYWNRPRKKPKPEASEEPDTDEAE